MKPEEGGNMGHHPLFCCISIFFSTSLEISKSLLVFHMADLWLQNHSQIANANVPTRIMKNARWCGFPMISQLIWDWKLQKLFGNIAVGILIQSSTICGGHGIILQTLSKKPLFIFILFSVKVRFVTKIPKKYVKNAYLVLVVLRARSRL